MNMFRIAVALFALLLINGAYAAIGVGATALGSCSGVTTCSTAGVTTTGSGSTFVIAVSFNRNNEPGNISSVSDSKGNTYTRASQSSFGPYGVIYYCSNCTGGASHAVTVNLTTSDDPAVHFLEITGAATASYDSAVTATNTTGTSPYTATSGTTTQAAELLVSFAASDSGNNPATFAESTGFTIRTKQEDATSYWPSALATRVVSSTGAFTPSWTSAGATNATVIIVGFKEAAGGGGGVSVAPSAASLVLAGATSAIASSGNKTFAPSAGSLGLTGASPTAAVSNNRFASPSAALMAFSGSTSTIARQTYTWYTLPAPGGYDSNSILAGQTYPSGSWLRVVTDFAHITAVYSTGPLQNDINDYSTAESGYTGSDSATYEIKTPALATSQYTVTASINGAISIGPSAASLSFTAATPATAISNNKSVAPASAALAASGATPGLTFTAHKTVAPGAASLALTPSLAGVIAGGSVVVGPSSAAVTIAGATPAITAGSSVTLAPAASSLAVAGATPDVARTANYAAAPPSAVLNVVGSTGSVSVSGSNTIAPMSVAIQMSGSVPSIGVGQGFTVTPLPASLSFSEMLMKLKISTHTFILPPRGSAVPGPRISNPRNRPAVLD